MDDRSAIIDTTDWVHVQAVGSAQGDHSHMKRRQSGASRVGEARCPVPTAYKFAFLSSARPCLAASGRAH
jgi:hypothetical protein